jgi:3-methyladenine DNA glycosylase/8-oxoguanine DNA glycosylase
VSQQNQQPGSEIILRQTEDGNTRLAGKAKIIATSKPMGKKENRPPRQDGSAKLLPIRRRAIAHLTSDPVMSALIEKVGPIHLRPRRLPPFQSLAHAIIHQQLNSTAAGTILERFKRLFPDHEFPTAGQVAKASVERLRTAGLSRPKAAYIIDLANRSEAGLIPNGAYLRNRLCNVRVCNML